MARKFEAKRVGVCLKMDCVGLAWVGVRWCWGSGGMVGGASRRLAAAWPMHAPTLTHSKQLWVLVECWHLMRM